MEIFGIDAASFQGDVSWATVDAVCDFGWEKVSQGTGYVNPRWATAKPAMQARALASGFVPGAYLFLEAGNGAAQADHFAAVAGDLAGFGLAIDAEPTTTGSRPTAADAIACANRLRVHYPAHPIVGYDPAWYWGQTPQAWCDVAWESRYVSGIGSPARLYASVPPWFWQAYGGKTPLLLQFTSSAVVAGVSGGVDCSAYRGTRDQYAALVLPGPVAPPPPPPPVPPTDWQVTLVNRMPVLKQGAIAPRMVRRVQALATIEGAPCAEDGVFGPATKIAVERIQRAHFGDAGADGIVGPQTWAVLISGSKL